VKAEVLRSKFIGALVGTAVGDGLGAGLEGWSTVSEDEIRTQAEGRAVLRYTDDTHMMIGVAESLAAHRGFDGEHMALRFMDNYSHEPYRGYGPGPPRIFRMIREGAAWDTAASKLYGGGSFGNGAAMRIAPVGVFYYDDPPKLREVAAQSGRITHAHPLGTEGGVLQAYAVALGTAADPGEGLRAREFLSALSDFAEDDVYRHKLRAISELPGAGSRQKVVEELGHGVEAFQSVPSSIYSFLAHPGSYEDAVTYAISLGGDTDTIAAMTGAISGAYLGVEAIPARWRQKLENRDYIVELAEKLWRIRMGTD
jgi:poly(ADP-ribose) glycohydrolase ARH3